MKVAVEIRGYIDLPAVWDDVPNVSAIEIADYHYNDSLTVEDALDDLARRLKMNPDDFEVIFTPGE